MLISLYASHQKIYPRSVSGLFSKCRWAMVFLTQLVFYGLPWLEWGQRQAVLFDLGVRRFYIFGLLLYPQDFIYLTGILVISALSLFLFLFLFTAEGLNRSRGTLRRSVSGMHKVNSWLCFEPRQSASFTTGAQPWNQRIKPSHRCVNA